ncbi:hypothetical protein DFH09DRAFT_1085599 [Mycena vulgaris]|nr:hypothetical protein DFH09DRAFT_1085599 [Mycena vulgaris]
MSKLSLYGSSATNSLAPAIDDTMTLSLPMIMVAPPEPYDEDCRIELHEVHLPNWCLVYHVEVWHGSHPATVMKYENIDTLEVYTLYLTPLSCRAVATNPDAITEHEFKVILPPYNTHNAVTKLISGVNPYFTGHHPTTHHAAASVDIWCTMHLVSPKDFLFRLHHIQNDCCLRYGSTLRAPSTFNGVAVVVEKVAESVGWTLLELHLLSTNHTIYLHALSDWVAIDRTWYGRAGRSIRIWAQRLLGKYHDKEYARILAVMSAPPMLSPMGIPRRT